MENNVQCAPDFMVAPKLEEIQTDRANGLLVVDVPVNGYGTVGQVVKSDCERYPVGIKVAIRRSQSQAVLGIVDVQIKVLDNVSTEEFFRILVWPRQVMAVIGEEK